MVAKRPDELAGHLDPPAPLQGRHGVFREDLLFPLLVFFLRFRFGDPPPGQQITDGLPEVVGRADQPSHRELLGDRFHFLLQNGGPGYRRGFTRRRSGLRRKQRQQAAAVHGVRLASFSTRPIGM